MATSLSPILSLLVYIPRAALGGAETIINNIAPQLGVNTELIVICERSSDVGKLKLVIKSRYIHFAATTGKKASDAILSGLTLAKGRYVAWMSIGDFLEASGVRVLLDSVAQYDDKAMLLIAGNGEWSGASERLLLEGYAGSALLLADNVSIKKCLSKNEVQHFGVLNHQLLAYMLSQDSKVRYIHKKVYRGGLLHKTDTTIGSEVDGLLLEYLRNTSIEQMEVREGSEYNYLVQRMLQIEKLDYPKTKKHLAKEIKAIEVGIEDSLRKRKAKVTVITPLYNNCTYVVDTIRSIEAQTYKDFVYIILDDGSQDNSGKVVAEHIRGRDNFYYLYHKNIGEADTVNRGWGLCYGEYFTQINSDDLAAPTLLEEMTNGLDRHKNSVVGYSGFHIIDKAGKTTEVVINEPFELMADLPKFNCYAATPGAFIRKSSFGDWEKIKDSSYRYINDIKMLWDMALVGDFLYIPSDLGAWRSHQGGISADRYKSAPEVERWLDEFFAKDGLPKKVKAIEAQVRVGVYKYLAHLLATSDAENKESISEYYKQKAKLPMPRYANLQIGDNDLIGNKFNGHDLHINLRKMNVDASHLVWNKESDDPNTYVIAGQDWDRDHYRGISTFLRNRYSLDYVNNHLMYEIMYNKLFLDADIIHMHLMHNGLLDFAPLVLAARLKPIVWTIHDSWIISGDEITGYDEGYFFPTDAKDMAVSYAIKKAAIQSADITYIANSKYTKRMLESSSMFKGKRIYHIPFGINLSVFKPRNKDDLRKRHGIAKSEVVLMARGSGGERKGADYVEYAVRKLSEQYKNLHLIVVGSGGDLEDLPDNIKVTRYDWIKDDMLLAELYGAADLFLMPSRREYFGMMAVEAMACGTLALVIEGTSLPDAVNAPEHGVSTERNKESYYRAVKYYIDHENERSERAERCAHYVQENHDQKMYTKAIDELYIELMSKFTIDDESKKVLSSMKKELEITPVVDLVVHDKNKIVKMKRLYKKTIVYIKREGLHATSIRIAKKVYKKTKSIVGKD